MDLESYRDNLDHPARLDKRGRPEPTRQLRKDNRLYCLVWTKNDLFKVGLGSGKNARDTSALRSITKYFAHDGITPGRPDEWRADLRALDDKAWGDGQRFEMVFATALKERLNAQAAGAVGLEWFFRRDLHLVEWEGELTAATIQALCFRVSTNPKSGGSSKPSERTRRRGPACPGWLLAARRMAERQQGWLACHA